MLDQVFKQLLESSKLQEANEKARSAVKNTQAFCNLTETQNNFDTSERLKS
jgi:hypothetical protein